MPTSANNNHRRHALADALSGVAATLVSLWAFYPIEFVKTNLQASNSNWRQLLLEAMEEDNGKQLNDNTRLRKLQLIFKSLFQGCTTKTLQAASSSFCYFFLYSWIISKYGRKSQHASSKLLLSAVAAMLNTVVTLPLDVISSQQITDHHHHHDDNQQNKMNEVWTNLNNTSTTASSTASDASSNGEPSGDGNTSDQQQPQVFYEAQSGEEEECHRRFDQDASACISSQSERPSKSLPFFSSTLQQYTHFWKGLTPALLLCSNPAIHYTVYDLLKHRLLHTSTKSLSMSQAFLLGWTAKLVATLVTYPLIRAKVLLMVAATNKNASLLSCLQQSYRDGTLYKGCNWQLIHTLLKSALMMMVRERITDQTRQLVVGNKSGAKK